MSTQMENPPDLLVAFAADEPCPDKRRRLDDSGCQQHDEVIGGLRAEKQALERELHQLREELAHRRHAQHEFDDQSHLLQQRFHEEIETVIRRQDQLAQQLANDVSAHVTRVLRKSIENIESLRLLHQKELCARFSDVTACLGQQSGEMNELCEHLMEQHCSEPAQLLQTLTDDCRSALDLLKTSFDSKVNYLNGLHTAAMEKSNAKHALEMEEIKCELNLARPR